MDDSDLDRKYIIDEHVYNCAFCNRRNVGYAIVEGSYFNWTRDKTCYVYILECSSCSKKSMHLSFRGLALESWNHYGQGKWTRFSALNRSGDGGFENYDEQFFYSVPTSFFVLDSRIPRILRELVIEAEGCLKSNFLTGASACARKVVYELSKLQGADGDNYEDKLKSLKAKFGEVEEVYFDTLLTIQQLTSTKVHEGSYDGWSSNHVRLILASLREALHEIYVVPAKRDDRRREILALKAELAPTSDKAEKVPSDIEHSSNDGDLGESSDDR